MTRPRPSHRPSPSESSPVVPSAAAVDLPQELWLPDLRKSARRRQAWLWHGYLAPGSVTLLTSQWKSGKTTLLSVLLAKLGTGGELAGQALAAGKAVVVSEESPAQWELRSRKLDFGDHNCWLCRPFRAKPRLDEWLALLDRLADLQARHGLSLAVFDTLASLLPGRDESNAGRMLEALTPLQRLTSRGMSVLLVHHPRKQESLEGMAARGSGALPGFVDILLEMDWFRRHDAADRRRRLRGFSRFEETPRQVVLELNAAGTDYQAVADEPADESAEGWQRLRMVLEDAGYELTRREILAEWPPDFDKPDGATLWKWLQRAAAQGLVCQQGSGRKNDPFRYWLPGKEEQWQGNAEYILRRQEEETRKLLDQLSQGKPLDEDD